MARVLALHLCGKSASSIHARYQFLLCTCEARDKIIFLTDWQIILSLILIISRRKLKLSYLKTIELLLMG